MKKGILFVISGFSGSGKGTVLAKVLKLAPKLRFSVSATSRAPRKTETEGKDYFFVPEETFRQMIEKDEFLEYTKTYGNYYGTPKAQILGSTERGEDVVLELDVIGAVNLKKIYPDAVTIFLTAPSLEAVKNRLLQRGSETPESIALRIEQYKKEIEYIESYDYAVINDDIDRCAEDILAIMRAENRRTKRLCDLKSSILNGGKYVD
jgi:guanylate kinase